MVMLALWRSVIAQQQCPTEPVLGELAGDAPTRALPAPWKPGLR